MRNEEVVVAKRGLGCETRKLVAKRGLFCCETRTLLRNEDFLTLANRKKGCESRKMVAKACGCESRKVAKAGSLTLKNRGVAKA